jgi:hypothetical protein
LSNSSRFVEFSTHTQCLPGETFDSTRPRSQRPQIVNPQDQNAWELSPTAKTVTCARFGKPAKNDSGVGFGKREGTTCTP